MFATLSAILHLGNMQISDDKDGNATLGNDKHFQVVEDPVDVAYSVTKHLHLMFACVSSDVPELNASYLIWAFIRVCMVGRRFARCCIWVLKRCKKGCAQDLLLQAAKGW
jgi:hypothetical protein